MSNLTTNILKDLEQKVLTSLNLFAMETQAAKYGPDELTGFTKRIMEDLESVISQVREETLKENKGCPNKQCGFCHPNQPVLC